MKVVICTRDSTKVLKASLSLISGISNEVVKDQPPPNETPFAIGYNDNVCYKDLDIPLMKIKLKVALVTLTKAKSLYLKFLLNSTDQKSKLFY